MILSMPLLIWGYQYQIKKIIYTLSFVVCFFYVFFFLVFFFFVFVFVFFFFLGGGGVHNALLSAGVQINNISDHIHSLFP